MDHRRRWLFRCPQRAPIGDFDPLAVKSGWAGIADDTRLQLDLRCSTIFINPAERPLADAQDGVVAEMHEG